MPFIMSQNLQRISVSVDKNEYEDLKKLVRPGISIGFLIRESIHQFLEKTKKN
tara:strand:- start:529 stop:687 length:159 start_codon:yes stop_codon:yes gene_type:complete